MRIIRTILNQTVDLIFGLIALALFILHFIHLNKLNEMMKKLMDEIANIAWTGYALPIWDKADELGKSINEWQEAAFLWLVVGYVAFNIIMKVKTILKREDICKFCGKSMIKREEGAYFCMNQCCNNYLKTIKK